MIKRSPRFDLAGAVRLLLHRAAPEEERTSYTGYGRFALRNVFEILGLRRGDRVLVPAYICDAVLVPFAALGIEPVYYAVTEGFQIDWESVKVPPGTRALITVNYFGISLDYRAIETFAASHGLVWVSDNAHGFAGREGGKSLDEFGDLSITCFRKVLPVINGARVRINSDRFLPLKKDLERLNAGGTREPRLRFAVKTALASFGIDPWPLPDYSDIEAFRDSDPGSHPADSCAIKLCAMADQDEIRGRRRALYLEVARFIKASCPEIEEIPGLLREGVSPLVLPVMVRDPGLWTALLRESRLQGLDLHTWPTLPADVAGSDTFGSVARWRRMLYFPLHQDLQESHYLKLLKRVLDEV